MIFIACCDENVTHLNKLMQEIAMLGVGERVNAVFFTTPHRLTDFMQQNPQVVDILLCDTVLQNKSTIAMVQRIKKTSPWVQVIFMSVLAAWCEKTYAVEHVYFLKKPVRQDALANAVILAARRAKQQKEGFLNVKNRNEMQTIPFSEILYIESALREVRIVTQRQSISAYIRISDLAKRLDYRFINCHKSYVVNLEKVEHIGGLQFILADGQAVPISQARYLEAKQRFMRYTGDLRC